MESDKYELKIFDRAVEHVRSTPTLGERHAIDDMRRASFIAGYRVGFLDGQTQATKRETENEPNNAA